MALLKNKEIQDTGLGVDYHRIDLLVFEKGNDFLEAKFGMYSSKENAQNGKRPVGEFYVKIPMDQIIGDGNLMQNVYSLVKKTPEFEGAEDV